MGRPKGSKNKVKEVAGNTVLLSDLLEGKKPKRTHKAKPVPTSPILDKLLAAGFTAADLKAAIREALASGEVTATPAPIAEDKAALKHSMMNAPISPAEIAKLRKEAMANMALVKDPQLVVAEAVEQVIVPNWAKTPMDGAGLRHFIVKAIRNGDAVSFDKERWDAALKAANVRGIFHTCKPEGSAEVDPQVGQGGAKMNLWRVMIG